MTGSTTSWVKAKKSDDSGNCVEMRGHNGNVEIRDTKQAGAGPTLSVSPDSFTAWLTRAKGGELDSLLD